VEGMMKGVAIDRRRTSARVSWIVIASLTLSLLPLRVACELGRVSAAHTTSGHQTGHEGTSDLCCTNIDDGALMNSVVPDLSGGPSAPPLVILLVSGLILSGFVVERLRLAGAPPPSRSYYARSARILR